MRDPPDRYGWYHSEERQGIASITNTHVHCGVVSVNYGVGLFAQTERAHELLNGRKTVNYKN